MTNDEWRMEAERLIAKWGLALLAGCDADGTEYADVLAHISARPEPQAVVSEEEIARHATDWGIEHVRAVPFARAVLAASRQVPVGNGGEK